MWKGTEVNEESTTNPALTDYLALRDKAEFYCLDARHYRILDSWQQPGLHIRWGMHKQHHPEIFYEIDLRMWIDFSRGYTTPDNVEEFKRHQENIAHYFDALAIALNENEYPLEDLENQNGTHLN
jgi:hypothetical protein